MIRKIKSYIEQNNMLEQGDRIVIGVSGGADSICLLHVLNGLSSEYELFLQVVHINHGIRGEEADRDESFVKCFCEQRGLEFQSFTYDVTALAMQEGLTCEEAGRKVRYDAFFDMCRKKQCNKIAIAHNRNDNAETVLFHLFRGSGIRGISGIEAKREMVQGDRSITLIRPLLDTSRAEIEEYLGSEGIKYLTDSTNLSDDYSRNKIRNQILTYATREINQQSVAHIASAADSLREIEDYLNQNIQYHYESIVRQKKQSYLVDVKELSTEHIVLQKGIIRKLLETLAGASKDLEAKHVEAVLELIDKQVGKQIHLPYDIIAERDYDDIRVFCSALVQEESPPTAPLPIRLRIPGRTEAAFAGKYVEAELINYKNSDPVPKSSCAKWIDYDKIENAVEMRTRREGDYLQINASGGRKKLKDYYIDHKVPLKERDNQLLLADGNHIIWIPGSGERMSEKYKVDAATSKVLLIKMFDMEVYKDDES